jgi:hypothetical protein
VPVALARMDLEMDPRNPTIAVGRAFARLDGFRGTHKGVAFESLCEGALAAWTDFLIPLDTERARSLLKEERLAEPTDLEPWLQIARVSAAEDAAEIARRRAAAPRSKENPSELDRLLRMAPIAKVVREQALDALERGPEAGEIARLAAAVRKAQGTKDPDPEVSLRIAEASFDLGPRGAKRALEVTVRLAAAPNVPTEIAQAAALLRGHVLVALDRPGDARLARKMMQRLQPTLREPYAKTSALACERIASGTERPPGR